MDREEALRRLATHRSDLQVFGVKSLALFGSLARGQADASSDADFVVEFHGPGTFDQFMGLKLFLEDLLGCPVDLATRKALKPALWERVRREAIYVS